MNVKTADEIAIMKKAGRIVYDTLELARGLVCVGITTAELNDEIEKYILSCEAIPSFKNYNGFPAASCISVNEQVVHGIPGKRKLRSGDIVSVDVGAIFEGFHGDAARTFPVGEVDQELLRLIQVTEQCFWNGIAEAKDGGRIGDVSFAVESTAHAAGYGVVRELVGHGIGRNMHERPDVPNFGVKGRGARLCKGLTIAVEPMINEGTRDVLMLDDGWTVVTKDGKCSAHYENTIAITDGEPLVLTLP